MSNKSSWRIAPNPVPDSEIKETYIVDVVIVGGGHAGVCAARAAAEGGAKVALLEQQEEDDMRFVGGGEVGQINSKWQREHGVEPIDIAEFCNDWQLRSNNRANYRLIRRFAENSGDTFDWLIEPLSQEDKNDLFLKFNRFNEKWKGSLNGIKTWKGSVGFGPVALSNLLLSAIQIAKDHGAQFFFDTKGYQLIKENGRVTGVIAKNGDGEYLKFIVNKGVILAAGDFSGNSEMNKDLLVEIVDMYDEGVEIYGEGQDGSGIQMGVWAGGRLEPRTIPAMGGYYAYPGMGIIGIPGTLYTNAHGKRYSNEHFGCQHISHFPGAVQPNGRLWAIFDASIEEDIPKQPPGHSCFDADKSYGDMGGGLTYLERLRKFMKDSRGTGREGIDVSSYPMCQRIGKVYSGETIEELAYIMYENEDDRANFLKTIERYNELCRKGVDEDFGKDPDLMNTLDQPPFYAFGFDKDSSTPRGVDAYFLRTAVGGLLTDENQNVLGQDWEPIPGLYATGNTCGGRFGLQYFTPVAGVSLGMCHTLGREVGRTVAAL